MEEGKIIFFFGASGAGKSTLVDGLIKELSDSIQVEGSHFDSIGVPSFENMIQEYGSGKEWQRQKTHEWIERLVKKLSSKKLVIFEGQTEPKFIIEGFQSQNFKNYKAILVHASAKDRHYRLKNLRNQPELINSDMDNWANYLMEQARTFDLDVLDTSHLSPEKTVQFASEHLRPYF